MQNTKERRNPATGMNKQNTQQLRIFFWYQQQDMQICIYLLSIEGQRHPSTSIDIEADGSNLSNQWFTIPSLTLLVLVIDHC